MTDQELTAWLRDLAEALGKEAFTRAADRIEELVKERDDAREYAAKIRIRERAAEDAVISATDKLAKAMGALRKIADHKHFSWDQGWIQNAEARIASTALDELEGKE